MDKKQLILKYLKTKAKAFGFTKKELESVAADLANNLELEDDASEEDANAQAEKSVDAVLPFLKLSQAAASRAIQAFKDSTSVEDEKGESPKKSENEEPKKQDKEEQMPSWAKSLMEKIDRLEGEKTTDKRQSRLSSLLKDTGTFGKRTLKNFERMTFKSDEEFDEFFEDVKADLEALNQERANDGLAKLGSVPKVDNDTKHEQTEVLTDEQLDKLANEF